MVAMAVYGHRSVESFRRELGRNSQMRKACGLGDWGRKRHIVPPARVFTGFLVLLGQEHEEMERVFEKSVAHLCGLLPDFGKHMAGDGKYLDSYAKRAAKNTCADTDRRAENDAEYSVKQYRYTGSDGKEHVKKEVHYGFKAHIICDTATELPIAFAVTKGNADERKEMAGLTLALPEALARRAESLALDRGYDSAGMIRAVKERGICPVVDIRNCWKDGEATKQYKDTDMVYNYRGDVYYCKNDGGLEKMKYEGYDRKKKCLRYSHDGKIRKIYISYDERIFLPIARDSAKFKKLYSGRTSVERLNGRLDRDFMFEDHFIRGLAKMRTRVALSLIAMNALAISKLRRGVKKGLAAATRTGLPPAA
jgi:hypothetical protein